MKKISLVLVLTLAMGIAGVAYAQETSSVSDGLPNPGILPGNPLYFVKSVGEDLGGLFVRGQSAQINRGVRIAEKRLAEAKILAKKDKSELVAETVKRYEKELDKVQEKVKMVTSTREEGEEISKDLQHALATVASSTLKHQSVLADVQKKVPEQAKEAIGRAMQKSSRGHKVALSAMPEQARVKAKEHMREARQRVSDKLNELRNRGAPIPQVPGIEGGIPAGGEESGNGQGGAPEGTPGGAPETPGAPVGGQDAGPGGEQQDGLPTGEPDAGPGSGQGGTPGGQDAGPGGSPLE